MFILIFPYLFIAVTYGLNKNLEQNKSLLLSFWYGVGWPIVFLVKSWCSIINEICKCFVESLDD